MLLCTNCGGPLTGEGAFCGSCGASNAPKTTAVSDTSGNAAAALSYLFGMVTGILFLILDPFRQDRFVQFHAFQSIFFSVGWAVLWIVWTIFTGVFEAVTGGFLSALIIPIDCLLVLIGLGYWISLMYSAYQGKQIQVPILGRWAERQTNK